MNNRIKSLISQAAQVKNENWIKAISILQNGLQKFDNNPLILEAMGDLYLSKSKKKKALEYYRKASDAKPNDEKNLHKLANVHMLEFNFATAKNYLEQIVNPSAASIFKKAVCCIHLQLPDQAKSLLESIIDDPQNPEAVLFLLSEQYITLKDFAKAKDLLDSLQEKFPNSNKVTFLYGYYLFRRKKWLAAYDYLLRAKKQGFNFLGNIKILALTAYKVGLFSQAIDYYRKALQFSPFDSSIFEYLIRIYIRLDQLEKAKIIAKKIPVFVPKSKKLLDLMELIGV